MRPRTPRHPVVSSTGSADFDSNSYDLPILSDDNSFEFEYSSCLSHISSLFGRRNKKIGRFQKNYAMVLHMLRSVQQLNVSTRAYVLVWVALAQYTKDQNLVLKLSLGIAKLGPPTLSNALIKLNSGVSGTIGYLDLEYALSGQLTEKSDLFSFAMVLFEALCAKSSSTEIPECVDKGAGQPMMGEMEVELECALELQGSADAIKQLKESGTTTTTSLAPPPPPAHDMEDYTY
ncbi:hypothetical protein ACFX13_034451 [Malus domestica]